MSPRIHRLRALAGLLMMFTAFSAIAQDSASHTVQPGENLYRIAQQYGVTITALAQANAIEYTWRIVPGQTLVIPSDTSDTIEIADAAPVTEAEAPAAEIHTVTWGESLGSIASRYGMTLDQLARLNDITNPDLIYVGQSLTVSLALDDDTSLPGETAATALDALVEVAAPAAEPLTPNYSVLLPAPAETAVTTTTLTDVVIHTVTYGDSLSGIARRYGISMLAITQANNIYNVDTIYVGQELTIPAANMTLIDAGVSTVAAAPAPRLTIGREIIVDLSEQRIYAYENGVLVRNVLVSTGLPATPTVQGDFTAQRKYAAQTMTGPGYYLPDVPYVVYFYAGYALHGTYWHDNFGQPMSHGCVNLPTPEAEWFYNFVEIGTPISVQV
jgi:LysM repeat protein